MSLQPGVLRAVVSVWLTAVAAVAVTAEVPRASAVDAKNSRPGLSQPGLGESVPTLTPGPSASQANVNVPLSAPATNPVLYTTINRADFQQPAEAKVASPSDAPAETQPEDRSAVSTAGSGGIGHTPINPASFEEPQAIESIVPPFFSSEETGADVVSSNAEPEVRIIELPEPDLRQDIRDFPHQFWSDTKSLVSLSNGISVGIGAGLAAVSANNWDEPIRESTAAHPLRWGSSFSNIMDVAGHPGTQAGIAAALYAGSLLTDHAETHEFSMALINSLILTNVSYISLKYAFDTTRPDGGDHGFPSGHTASSFAVAAVVEEYYGSLAGTGAYIFAGLVAWQRIDDRKHDLSDVLFGMTLGTVIGTSVAKNHRVQVAGFDIAPYTDGQTGTTGVLFHKQY